MLTGQGFELHPVALDDEAGEADFQVNKCPSASSLRPMTSVPFEEWSDILEELQPIRVRKRGRMMEIGDDLLAGDLLIKVDAAAAETEILRGGRRIFALAKVVLIEANFVQY